MRLLSLLMQISVSKVLKTYFAYSVCQWGEGCSLLPWLRYWHLVPGGSAHSLLSVQHLVSLSRCIIEEFFRQKKLSFGQRSSLNKILVGVPAAYYTLWRETPQNSAPSVTILSDAPVIA